MERLELESMAHGGDAIAHRHGKVWFVSGAIPGDVVLASVVSDKRSFTRAKAASIVHPSPERVDAPCRYFGECGGCQWQSAKYEAQLRWKHETVAGQLAHVGGVKDPPMRPIAVVGQPFAYRNRMDFSVAEGRPALHRIRSKELVTLAECQLLVTELQDLLRRLGPLQGVSSITLRAGTRTSNLLALVAGTVPRQAATWQCSVAVRRRGRWDPVVGTAALVEVVADTRFRITGSSFFQNNTPGAEVLVRLVAEALQPSSSDVMLDAYAGVGLFSATLGPSAGSVVAVESHPAACDDLKHNTTPLPNIEVVGRPMETVEGTWDVAVVDPPRTGLGSAGVTAIGYGGPRRIAYVSCDPASLGRDTALLAAAGYRLEWVNPVDLFPQTFHVETVACFVAT